jgi:hypothetical protein
VVRILSNMFQRVGFLVTGEVVWSFNIRTRCTALSRCEAMRNEKRYIRAHMGVLPPKRVTEL